MDHLLIDLSRCIGCTACASVCIRGNIRMDVGHPVETGEGMGCFDCGHCVAICPKDAISLTAFPDFEPRGFQPKETVVGESDFRNFLERRRSIRWFTTEKVTSEEFDRLFTAATVSPSAENRRDLELVVIDYDMRRFMRNIADIMAPRADELPRFRQLIDYLNDPFPMGNNPLIWEGQQLILAFSEDPLDSVIAMARIELMAYTMGLGGVLLPLDPDGLRRGSREVHELLPRGHVWEEDGVCIRHRPSKDRLQENCSQESCSGSHDVNRNKLESIEYG